MPDRKPHIACPGCGVPVPDTDGPMHDYPPEQTTRAIQQAATHEHAAASLAEHIQVWGVQAWAQAVWEAWAPHHTTIRRWAEDLRPIHD